jgi:SAM-dependent methyltransferase
MKPFFIDENIKFQTGEEALKRLDLENDKKYFDEKKGVIKVDINRWKTAQRCEKNHWFVKEINSRDDRNFYHFKTFNTYESIKNKIFNNALEIGSGPFTNLRMIRSISKINNCDLLDPMIMDYLHHPNCMYDKSFLYSEKYPILGRILSKLTPSTFRKYLKYFSNKIKVSNLFNCPAEDLTSSIKYDLVVMINVIEHCYDIDKIFENILSISNPGTVFIFSDKLYDLEEINSGLKVSYDAAHPLKVEKNYLLNFLYQNFDVLLDKKVRNQFELDGEHFEWDDVYFIGKKKG